MPAATRVVVTDANILINLIHDLDEALARGDLRRESLTDLRALTIYADLRRIMGQGEAACLALAEVRGWLIASDEKRRFRREVQARLGQGRLVTTAGLFVLAIRAGTLSVEQADQAKTVLEQHRFRMTFGSFRELLAEHGSDDTSL